MPSTASTIAQAPLVFEPNVGQADTQVQFVARGLNYNIALSNGNAVMSLAAPGSEQTEAPAVVTMNLIGANSAPTASGLDTLASTSNYAIGNDAYTGIANYGQVQYQNIYAGINVVYYGNQQQLEYDFTVAPHANPGAIQLNFQGMQSMSVDSAGNLVLHTAGGDLVEHAPVVYQSIDGTRVAVNGQYVVEGCGQVGFQVGSYDPSQLLVIDPVLLYSTYLGGASDDGGYGVALDSSGNIYVTGQTDNATSFPVTANLQTTEGGGYDAFVTKLSPTGTIIYSTYLGGNGYDQATAIAVDSAGNAYVVGTTDSTNFPTTSGAIQKTFGGGSGDDAFYTKLNANGAVVYSTYLGGSNDDGAAAVALDSAGNVYITGDTSSTNFPTTPAAAQLSLEGNYDGFVTKITANGSLGYSTYLGGGGYNSGRGIAVDSAGDAYVTGYAGAANFPTTTGAYQTTFAGAYDAFVTKLSPTGSISSSTLLGGSGTNSTGDSEAYAIALDSSDNVFVTGYTSANNFPTTANAFEPTFRGSVQDNTYNAFVTKFAANGTLAYSTYLGGSGSVTAGTLPGDGAFGLALDSADNIYVVGVTSSTDFPTTTNAPQPTYGGGTDDAFVTELSVTGSLAYSTYLGGSGDDEGFAIAVDSAGNAYVTGITSSTNFTTTSGALQTAAGAGVSSVSMTNDAFLSKIGVPAVTKNTALLLLDPTNQGSLNASGDAALCVEGNVSVDSSSAAGTTASGNANLNATEFDLHGNAGYKLTGNARVNGTIVSGVPLSDAWMQVPADLAALPAPMPAAHPITGANYSGWQSATLSQGTYAGIQVSGNASVTLAPGVYYLTGPLSVSGNAQLNGQGVIIYLGTGSNLNISGNGSVTLTPPTTGTYEGVVLFGAPSSSISINISGNADLRFAGTIYVAATTITVSGNGELQGFDSQIVAYNLSESGNAEVELEGNADNRQMPIGTILSSSGGGSGSSGSCSSSSWWNQALWCLLEQWSDDSWSCDATDYYFAQLCAA